MSSCTCTLFSPGYLEEEPKERLCSLQASSSLSVPTHRRRWPLFGSSCGVPRREVRHPACSSSPAGLILNYANAPGPSVHRGEMAMAIARLPCALVRSTSDVVFSPLYSVAVLGAAGHNRGESCREAASRQDTKQELGPWFNFKAYAVGKVSLTPGERPQV